MENDILDALDDLGYEGPLLEENVLEKAIDGGPNSSPYTSLVEWITTELAAFHGIEEKVNHVNKPEDCETFLMELSGFLREYGCPHNEICEGPLSKRLETKEQKLILLDYLLSELATTKISAVRKPQLIIKKTTPQDTNENDYAKVLKSMCITLGFPKPPNGITPFQLFTKIEQKMKALAASVPPAHLSKPMLKARLSDKQWETIDYVNTALKQEYTTRREMMLKRLDLTIQSFQWSDKAKSQNDKLVSVYQPIRRVLKAASTVELAHLLAAREDLLHLEKTSSGTAREKTKCEINRVRIGKVPDRGGRAYELEPPPPEMPSFMQRKDQPQGQRQRGGQSWGSFGRSRHQGNQYWGDGDNKSSGGGYWKDKKRGRYQ